MRQELNELSLPDLCDLLVTKTTELLKLIERKETGSSINNIKYEVEQIQEAIKIKKHSHL